jgi:UDP-N-acetylmuramoylalanine--D-glutamate ligase
MRAVVLGLGKSGRSAYNYLVKKGYTVVGADDATNPVSLAEMKLDQCQFLVLSPGIPMTHPACLHAKAVGVEIVCDIELALREKRNAPIFAITGTNGKTTTTLLTAHMLQAAGKKAHVAGNIGVPVLDRMEDPDELLVIEVSSFQLQMMRTKAVHAAVIINISPNHLDHHASFDEYVSCKQHLGSCLSETGQLYVSEKAHKDFIWKEKHFTFGLSSSADLYSDGSYIYHCNQKEIALPEALVGKYCHDVENFLAAYSLCRSIDISPTVCVEAYNSFTKPPHRIQFVKEIEGVSYYNDSKATNIEAVLSAVSTFSKPIVLIAGGVHKGFGYQAWKKPFKEKVKAVVLIGQAASLIENDLGGIVPVIHAKTLQEAVKLAKEKATKGDVVLLSPGCSSYDMFKSYEDRGNKFQGIVNEGK